MKSIAHEISQRLLVLGVLLCAFPVFAALFYGWAFKTFMIDDWGVM